MIRFIVIAVAVASCSNRKQSEGLPPAQEWGAEPAGGAMVPQPGASPHAAAANPHAGIPGMEGDDPHAGVDMTNPHAGTPVGGSPDVAKLGLPPPDPNRPIDPTHHVKGVIRIDPKAKDRVAPGTAVFVIVKRADAAGQPTGAPLAVDKLTWQKDELPFEMTEAQAMIGGTQLVGDVVVVARYDQDGDAISKQPGDIVGQVRVTIPADGVKLTLDTILP